MARAEVVINAYVVLVLIVAGRCVAEKIVGSGSVGQRPQVGKLHGHRIEAASGYAIAGKRVARIHAILEPRGSGVEHRYRKDALPLSRSWNISAQEGAFSISNRLIVEEEEGLVADDGPSDAESVLVVRKRSLGDAGPIIEEIIGVEVTVAEKLIKTAVERVRSGLAGKGYQSTAGSSELRVVQVCADPELLCSI